MNEDDLTRAKVEDKIRQCAERYAASATGFLDLHQQSAVRGPVKDAGDTECIYYGGYDDAERCILVCLPDYETLKGEDYLDVIRVQTAKGSKKPSHRDYLGSLLGLGIKREKIGDILVREDGADIIAVKEISDFVLRNYSKAGRTELKAEKLPISRLIVPEARTKTVTETVSSCRLDNVVACGFGMSRSKATEAIAGGRVFVNSMETTKPDRTAAEGDKIVLRGKGKIVLSQTGGRSKKGREYITVIRYI
ncbi:MAG: YlmH/Sll1252 family protein [Eubacteriaceae bacterium]|nr:YlmH/Sll1252 family protein [Eubacteriaceae bacterium]